jgi:hypothetical protein
MKMKQNLTDKIYNFSTKCNIKITRSENERSKSGSATLDLSKVAIILDSITTPSITVKSELSIVE